MTASHPREECCYLIFPVRIISSRPDDVTEIGKIIHIMRSDEDLYMGSSTGMDLTTFLDHTGYQASGSTCHAMQYTVSGSPILDRGLVANPLPRNS